MSEQTDWQKANDEYLATGLHWLHLRLDRLAPQEYVTPEIVESKSLPTKQSGSFFRRWFTGFSHRTVIAAKTVPNTVASPRALVAVSSSILIDEQIKMATTAMSIAETSVTPPALEILTRTFGLSGFERQVLLLCAARDLDTRIDDRCAYTQADATRRFPTFALALAALEDPLWDALSPDRPLRYWHLIEINQSTAQAFTSSSLRADERIVNYIKGLNYLDDRVARLISPLHAHDESVDLPASQQSTIESIKHAIEQAAAMQRLPVVQLLGREMAGKQQVAMHAAGEFRRLLYRLPVELLPANQVELETFIRLLQRESRLLPIALYLDARESDKAHEGCTAPLNRFLSAFEGLVFLDTAEQLQSASWQSLNVHIAKPTKGEMYTAWMSTGDESFAEMAKQLAEQFSLDLATIKQIAASSDHDRKTVWQACRAHLRPRLEGLAQHLEPRRVWDGLDPRNEAQRKEIWDCLVLPEPEKRLLLQIAAQVEHRFAVYEDCQLSRTLNRGLGISALFTGESGTGKTFAAEVLAKVLDLDLYRIDLSSVVSKYIGETEKNLRRLFDTAEDSGVVLFFDEADALFGKRSEVKDSHDRYANIEINYLLQRLEAYDGLAILATNLKSALDQAFMRRLRFVVNFPFPTPTERLQIWKKSFPAGIPLEQDLNFERLAHLNLTGGNIQSIAINAAFLAAGRASPSVTQPLIMEAARDEMRKLDKQFSEADFRVN
jgi:hypothetical protein